MPQHPCGRPSAPLATAAQKLRTFRQTARHCEHERHGHVGGVFVEHVGRVGDSDAFPGRCCDVDIVDAIAEIGDELQTLAGLGNERGIDSIRDRGNKNVSFLDRSHELGLRHALVVEIEARVEQLAHARFDLVRQLAGDDDERLLPDGHTVSKITPC